MRNNPADARALVGVHTQAYHNIASGKQSFECVSLLPENLHTVRRIPKPEPRQYFSVMGANFAEHVDQCNISSACVSAGGAAWHSHLDDSVFHLSDGHVHFQSLVIAELRLEIWIKQDCSHYEIITPTSLRGIGGCCFHSSNLC